MTSRRNIQIGLICVVFSIVVLENANAARRANLPDLGEDVQKYIYKILVDDSLHPLVSDEIEDTLETHPVNLDRRGKPCAKNFLRELGGNDYYNSNDLCWSPEQWCAAFGPDVPTFPNNCAISNRFNATSFCPPPFSASTPDLVCFRPTKYCRDAFSCEAMETNGLFPNCCEICKSSIMFCCTDYCQTCLSQNMTIDLYGYFGMFVGEQSAFTRILGQDVVDKLDIEYPRWTNQVGLQFLEFRSALCPPLMFNYRCRDVRSAIVFCWLGRDIPLLTLEDPRSDFWNCVNVVYNTTHFCPCIDKTGRVGLEPTTTNG